MKVIKLDRRYAGFPTWKYAIQFPLRNHNFRQGYFKYKNAFQATYGPDAQMNPDYHGPTSSGPAWLYSDTWRCDFKRQRILVKDQALITMIRLKIAD